MNSDIERASALKEFMKRCGYNGKYDTTDDHQINLYDSLLLYSDINKYNTLRKISYKFNNAKTIHIIEIEFDDYDFLPNMCTNIMIEHNGKVLKQDLKIKTQIITSCLIIKHCNSHTIEIVNPIAQIGKINIHNSNVQKIFIHENAYVEEYIKLDNLYELPSFDRECLTLPNENKHIYIHNLCLITGFSEQENIINTEQFTIDNLPSLKSWRNIDKIKISVVLKIHRIATYNNIINLMLVDSMCEMLTPFAPLEKYRKISNRSDYIMDFAVELIDADLECGAEL